MTDLTRTSAIKLGLAVAWPAFWTGVPLKIVLVLLFLAAGLHPWELPAAGLLLLLSIPIDIWALGLASRSVFLERLRREPPDGLALTLWWQIAVLSVVYVPIAFVVERQTIALVKTVASHMMDLLPGVPVAERIGIELVLWGGVAIVLLIVLVVGWLYAVGTIVRRQAVKAPSITAPYPLLVKRWDLMRIPADQTLVLTVLVAAGVVVVMLFWAFMPVTTPHPHEEYKKAVGTAKAKPLKPTEVLQKTETVIAQAEASVQALEAKGQSKEKGPAKGHDAKEPRKVAPKSPGPTDAAKSPPSGSATGPKHDDHDSIPHSH